MKRRTYTLMLALALSASLLTACGSSGGQSQENTSSSVSSGQSSTSQEDSSSSSGSTSTPDGSSSSAAGSTSTPDGSAGDSSTPVEEPQDKASLSLSSNDFSLFQAGSSYTLEATVTGMPKGAKVTYKSGDEKVATVDEKGKVTAVAPGTAKITVTVSAAGVPDLTGTCVVRCKFEAEKPSGGNSSSSGGSTSTPEATKVDLNSFYTTVSSTYNLPHLTVADATLLDNYYAGLSAISMEQSAVYINMMSMNNGELALVQVKDAADVDKVKAIFQARIDYMVGDGNGPGGAWYPEPTRIWDECSRVVSNGNYVMMVVGESCDSVVNDFNALF